jgi:hypothetical protein
MGFGRFVCVALPFCLTLASLICILIVMVSGMSSHNLDMFEVNTKNLSISSSSLQNLANELKKRDANPGNELSHLTSEALESVGSAINGAISGQNFTASELGLADSYKVFMWNYCSYNGTSSNCTKAAYNWAASSLNTTALNEKAAAISLAATGVNATFPKDITGALKTYIAVSRWTQIVYIIAFILCVLTLVVGLFGFCSRIGSCFTYFISGIATTSIIIASVMATVSSAVVVAAVNSSAKAYKVTAKLNTSFLSVTWIAVAFSIGAGLFWLFSVCCCKSEHHNNKRQTEKFGPTSYTPLHENNTSYPGQQQGVAYNQNNMRTAPAGAAYEPYSHANV